MSTLESMPGSSPVKPNSIHLQMVLEQTWSSRVPSENLCSDDPLGRTEIKSRKGFVQAQSTGCNSSIFIETQALAKYALRARGVEPLSEVMLSQFTDKVWVKPIIIGSIENNRLHIRTWAQVRKDAIHAWQIDTSKYDIWLNVGNGTDCNKEGSVSSQYAWSSEIARALRYGCLDSLDWWVVFLPVVSCLSGLYVHTPAFT